MCIQQSTSTAACSNTSCGTKKYGKNKSGRQSPNKQCYRSRVLSSGRPASSLTVLSSFIECSSNY
jgi:hypothetical protein